MCLYLKSSPTAYQGYWSPRAIPEPQEKLRECSQNDNERVKLGELARKGRETLPTGVYSRGNPRVYEVYLYHPAF